ncbi:MAG: TIGR04282 family arsenosugar biosynthesis glycosyltransferase [Haloechinothrix sp.]
MARVMRSFCVLVVAKAPIPGFVKTRLCPPLRPEQAAAIAAACLLDTLTALRRTAGALPVVAMLGDLTEAVNSTDIAEAVRDITLIRQRGEHFAARLANAHADAATRHPGVPVVQIGMDTPQVTSDLLASAAAELASSGRDAVLGPAADGGWWALGMRDPLAARVLTNVPMSLPSTGVLTRRALSGAGLTVATLPTLSDVDTVADIGRVARAIPHSNVARAVTTLPWWRCAMTHD